jgi:molybdopterin molybdotransferase
MISVEEARTRIVAAAGVLPAERVMLSDALGRVLAEDVASRRTQPPLAVSAMDGWAVRAADVADVPAVLRRIGTVPAGAVFEGLVGPGEAVRIFTGAPVPAGADTIVIQENAESTGDRVTIHEGAAEGRYIRRAGLDFAEGDVLLRAGRLLNARDIGLAAAMNRPWLAVRRRPRVALLATGDEIALPGEPIGPNQIVSSSGPALAAFVRACGGEPVHLGVAADSVDSLRMHAAGAAGTDILVTLGGASVGEHDLVQAALAKDGLAVDFWRIAMRPGKPLMFGRLGDTLVLGLPGNPVSALVCALLFLRPLILRLSGRDATALPLQAARLGAALAENDRREDYIRATLTRDATGFPVATPFSVQDSSMLSRLVLADCLIVRAPHAPAATAGATVDILRLAGDDPLL